jgi:hypothetical protein
LAELRQEQFGYQLLPFQYGRKGDQDCGLSAVSPPVAFAPGGAYKATFNLLPAVASAPRDPFASVIARIDTFHDSFDDEQKGILTKQIVFCRDCRCLQLIAMRDTHECPACRSDLIAQS